MSEPERCYEHLTGSNRNPDRSRILAMADRNQIKRNFNLKTLRPKKHKQIDFFVADEFNLVNFRDEMASMEHPFFALKGGDTRIREYVNGNINVTVRPAVGIGMATVFDKDVWIYAISKRKCYI